MKASLAIPPHHIGNLWLSEQPSLDDFHRHDELECNLVVSGQGAYLLNERRVPLQKNCLFWLFPEQEHLMLDQTADFQLWIIVIRPAPLAQLCQDKATQPLLASNPPGNFVRHLDQTTTDNLVTLCRRVHKTADSIALFNAGLSYLLLAAWAAFQTGSLVPLPDAVHPAVTHIAKTIYAGKTADNLHALAQQVGMAPETISRLFKKQAGISLSEFRNRCRLNRFLELYGHGHSQTMLAAALSAGFGSYAQFYRVFRQMMGITPATYRQQQQTTHEV